MGLAPAMTVSVSGCSDDQNDEDDGAGRKANGHNTKTRTELESVRGDVENIYARLNGLPITDDDGTFVFDLNAFETEFDHERLVAEANDAIDRLTSMDSRTASDADVSVLVEAAELAGLLVRQRAIVHQVIAAGLTFERRFVNVEYGQALEAIRNGVEFLEYLSANGESIEAKLDSTSNEHGTVAGYDPTFLRETQQALIEMAHWVTPAYEGLHRAIRGFKVFEEGNAAISEERYDAGRESFETARQRFEGAANAFENAQRRGRRVPHLVPIVEGMRCLVPAYISSCTKLRDSMEAYNSGDEERGEELAEEAITSAREMTNRCS